jgi:hypothetical protein
MSTLSYVRTRCASAPCKTNLAATNHQHFLVLHLPRENQGATALDLREVMMRHFNVMLGMLLLLEGFPNSKP